MSGLDTAIRAKLDEIDASMTSTGSLWGAEEMRDAIEAVLDLHGGNHLGHLCPDPAKNYSEQRWYEADNPEDPCPTVRAIAEKLGVEVERG